jgi:DNA-binding GntR family transcriptional regulator
MLQTVSTVDALTAALEAQILEGGFAPGDHLREQELTAEYDVARHSLRAAADALVRKGLLVKKPNRGFFIPNLTREDGNEIFELRFAYEWPAVRALTERREVPSATREALDSMHVLDDGAPWPDIIRADRAFHRSLVESLGNSRFARAHADLMSEISLCVAQTWETYEATREVAAQHERLVDTIAGGDVERAELELREHFDNSLRRMKS